MFAFLGWPDLWLRILSRVVLLPLVAGISYEIIRFAGSCDNPFVAMCMKPGLWLQYLTTREPSDDQDRKRQFAPWRRSGRRNYRDY